MSVASFDVYPNSTIKPSALQRHMQQYGREDCDELGCTYIDMRNVNMVFVMTKMGISVNKPVFAYDELTVRTYNNKISGVTFVREFEFYRGGEEVIHATTQWAIVNYSDRKIVRPRQFPFPIPEHKIDCATIPLPRSIDTEGLTHCGTRTVHLSDLDENDHLNNCIYSDISMDVIPYDRKNEYVKEACIIFRHEARIEDILNLANGEKDGAHIVSAYNSTNGEPCFDAQFILGKISG